MFDLRLFSLYFLFSSLHSFNSPIFSPQCNNPMTKEPKLNAAVRIVAEWTDYDQEVKRLQTKVQQRAADNNHTAQKPDTGI